MTKTTLVRLNQRIKNAAQTAKQLRQQISGEVEVSRNWSQEIDEMGQSALDIFYEAQRLKQEMEVASGHKQEAHEAADTLENMLNNALTVLGPNGKHLAFLQATSPINMAHLIGFIIQFPEVFQEVLENSLSDEDFASLGDVFDITRRNRLTKTD